jgi:uncharacterized protein
MSLTLEIAESLQQIDAQSWDALTGRMPLLSHAFLNAMETSNSVGHGTGWQPCPMLVHDDGRLVGAIPLFVKSHSYGEYVFDWSWAEAYQRNGLNYYPKLIAAIPFSPVTSARFLVADVANAASIKAVMLQALLEVMHKHQLSSVHILFPDQTSAALLKQAGWLERHGVQFRWENEDFESFDAFLIQLTQEKRKKIRQERRKVDASGVICRRIKGLQITDEEWDFFYQCYCNTYVEHRSTPYLSAGFFKSIALSMPENILLIMASLDGEPIASALNFYDQDTLYGRYWGCMQYVPNLHFELCYYQAQEFCIEEKVRYFEGGAQGEHKLARGFKPKATCSFHQIANQEFAQSIADFLTRESLGVAEYTNELEQRAPFKLGVDSNSNIIFNGNNK